MRALLTMLLFGFCLFNTVNAQDDDTWPPDPASIFSENIEVMSIIDPDTGWPNQDKPASMADNEHRLIRIFSEHTNSWHEYVYPDEIEQVFGSPQVWGNTVYFAVQTQEDGTYWILWKLDLDTTEFETFVPCPDKVVYDNFITDERWILATDLQTREVYLCDYQLGELYDQLPTETSDWSALLVSPDESYVLLQGKNAEYADRGGPYEFYSYEIATGNFTLLGSISSWSSYSTFEGWLNDVQILYKFQDTHYSEYFLIDVRYANSIERLIRGNIERREHPERLEELETHAVLSRQADLSEHVPCRLNVVDLATVQTFNFELGHDCGGVYSPNEYSYFYVSFQPDPLVPSSLELIDIRSSNPIPIIEGEIEALESASPDGRYAVVITDNNGVIDRQTVGDTQFFTWSQTNNPVVSFVDVSTRQIVYETPYDGWFNNQDPFYGRINYTTYSSGIPQTGVVWLNNNTCLVERLSSTSDTWVHTLLEFNDVDVNAIELDAHAQLVLPDARQLILADNSQPEFVEYSLYDIATHQSLPLFINPDPEQYRYGLFLDDNGEINLHISLMDHVTDGYWINYIINVDREPLSES